jgi:hypothetical protein
MTAAAAEEVAVPDPGGRRARDLGWRRQTRRVYRRLPLSDPERFPGLRGTLLLTAGVAVLGFALTLGAAWKTCPSAREGRPPCRRGSPTSHQHPENPHLRAAGQARSVAGFTFMSDTVHLVFIWANPDWVLMLGAQASVPAAARAPRASSWWMWP